MWASLETEKWTAAGRILKRSLLETIVTWPLKRLPVMAHRRHECFYCTLAERYPYYAVAKINNTDFF